MVAAAACDGRRSRQTAAHFRRGCCRRRRCRRRRRGWSTIHSRSWRGSSPVGRLHRRRMAARRDPVEGRADLGVLLIDALASRRLHRRLPTPQPPLPVSALATPVGIWDLRGSRTFRRGGGPTVVSAQSPRSRSQRPSSASTRVLRWPRCPLARRMPHLPLAIPPAGAAGRRGTRLARNCGGFEVRPSRPSSLFRVVRRAQKKGECFDQRCRDVRWCGLVVYRVEEGGRRGRGGEGGSCTGHTFRVDVTARSQRLRIERDQRGLPLSAVWQRTVLLRRRGRPLWAICGPSIFPPTHQHPRAIDPRAAASTGVTFSGGSVQAGPR